MNNFSIAIDLGGTQFKSGLLKDNVLLEKKILDAESDKGLQPNLARLEAVIDDLLKKYEVKPGMLQGIGLAFPGIVNPLSKKIIATNKKYDDAPQLNLAEVGSTKMEHCFIHRKRCTHGCCG
jgi:glucokinase